MARKAKVVVPSAGEVPAIQSVEVDGKTIQVIDMGPVVEEAAGQVGGDQVLADEYVGPEELEAELVEEEVVSEETGPSTLMAQLVSASEAKVGVDVKVKSEKNDGVGIFIKNLINDGLSNKDILKIVHEQYGNKNTTYACVAWYRNKMKKTGAVQAKSSALDFITNFAKSNGLSEEAVETLKVEMKVA